MRGRVLGRLVIVAVSILLLSGCEQRAAPSPKNEQRISAPEGLAYSSHPQFSGADRQVIAGCCSFEAEDAEFTKLEGDLDGRELVGRSFRATISFGPGAVRFAQPANAGTSVIDGVKLSKSESSDGRKGWTQVLYTAAVPLKVEAEVKKIDSPELEIFGSCDGPKACDELRKRLNSIRF